MQKALLLLLPVLLLCGAGIFAFGLSGDDPRPPGETHEAAAKPVEAASAVSGAAPVDASADPSRPAAADTAVRDAVATHAALLPIPADAKWIEVKVVDKETQQPVPDATVEWFDETVSQRLQEEPALLGEDRQTIWRDPEERAARFGWSTTSDARGIARVHQSESTEVVAREGKRYGHMQLGRQVVPPRDGYRIEIADDRELAVQVVDAAGTPVGGIPVALAVYDAQGRQQYVWDWGPVATTRAPDGIARVRHLQSWDRREEMRTVAQWRVRTFVPGFEDPGVPCSLEAPGEAPIVLKLPPCGRVAARVTPDLPLPTPTPNISMYENAGQRGWGGARASFERPIGADGIAHFDHVPLGKSFRVNVAMLGNGLSKQFSGPVAQDAEVSVVLAPEDDLILLTGRLLDAQRVPLADQKFQLGFQGPQMGNSFELRTDPNGRFLAIAGRARNGNKAESITAEVRRPGSPVLVARAPGRELRAGTEDLGDLVAAADALLVAGRMLIDGKPGKKKLNPRIERFAAPDNGGQATWKRHNVQITQEDDGHFECRGTISPGRYRLVLQAWSHLPTDPIEFRPGTTDLVVDVKPGTELAATFLLPEGVREELQVELVPQVAPNPAWPEQLKNRLRASAWHREDGRSQVSWQGLPAATFRLEVGWPALPKPIFVLEDVQVPPPAGGDPRLVDIDLREFLRLQTIRLFGPDGQPLPNYEGGFFPLGQDPTKDLQGFPLQGHETKLLLPAGTLDLMVGVSGYQPREIRASGPPLDVRLDAWPHFVLLVQGLESLPPEARVWAHLELQNPPQRNYRAQWNSGELRELTFPPQSGANVENGRAELPIGEGAYTVHLTMHHADQGTTLAIPPTTVLSTTGTATVTVAPDAVKKAVDQAVKQQQLQRERDAARRAKQAQQGLPGR